MLWSYRKAAHHGKLPHFTVSYTHKQLQEQASEAYRRYEADPHSIPHSRRHLFHKPLESILTYSDESLRCWIASVKEAELTAEQRLKIYSHIRRNTLHHYFGLTTTVNRSLKMQPKYQTCLLHHFQRSITNANQRPRPGGRGN
jgi:hypothetical protein